MVVIDNGISTRGDPSQQPGARNRNKKVIAFAGRFDQQKGFDTYVEVMRRLGDEAEGSPSAEQFCRRTTFPTCPRISS